MNDQGPRTELEDLERELREERARALELERELIVTRERAAELAVELENHRTDIWAHEEVQQAIEAVSRSGSEFVIQVDQRLRTTLQGLLDGLEGLLGGGLDDHQRELVAGATGTGYQLLAILDDVLDYCRLDAGHVVPQVGPIDATALLEDVAIVVRQSLGDRPVEVRVRLDPDLPDQLLGDEQLLRRAVGHLADNAARHTTTGTIDLSLQLVGKGGDAQVQLEVRDTGEGIASEDRHRVQQAFETSMGQDGLGLGLALVRRLVEAQGGTYTMDGQPGEGTVAQIVFPVDRVLAPEVQPSPEVEVPGSEAVARVLVAEGDRVSQRVTASLLEELDCEVEVVGNGLQAIASLEQLEVDLILMDCAMPELDGYETTRRVRAGQVGEAHTSVPIVALTADDCPEARQECLHAGMDEYLTKPVSLEQLRTVLRAWLPPALRPPAA